MSAQNENPATNGNSDKLLVICECAIMVALALALSYLKIPIGLAFGAFGGSIDLVMIPLIVCAMRRGTAAGLVSGLVLGTLKYFLAAGFAVTWESMLLDYSLAYMAVGMAGLLRKTKSPAGYAVGALVGCLARFAVHFASGVTVYAKYMPPEFMEMTMTSTWVYSLLYNSTYMLPNTVIAVAACALLAKPLQRVPLSRKEH